MSVSCKSSGEEADLRGYYYLMIEADKQSDNIERGAKYCINIDADSMSNIFVLRQTSTVSVP
jgi:hypothetical protein